MQQRRLRLGDILDDYCTRERRVTNHAVVAMVEDTVKQTRCTTCDAEHEYKGARVPPQRRRKDGPGSVTDDVVEAQPVRGVIRRGESEDEPIVTAPEPSDSEPAGEDQELAGEAGPSDRSAPVMRASNGNGTPAGAGEPEEGPLHRPLIRATLPRPEGQVPARPNADFTMRHAPNHPAGFQANRSGRPVRTRAGAGRPAAGGGHGQPRFGPSRPNTGPDGNHQPGRGPRPGQGHHARPGGSQASRPGKKRR